MSMALVRKAKKYNDVTKFIAEHLRVEKNKRNNGPCTGMRELARIYYRAHRYHPE